MEARDFSECMANNTVILLDRDYETAGIPWAEHPKFKGVFLKHLMKGECMAGKLSCHMVKVIPHCVLEEHIHQDHWELHEVIAGEGILLIETREASYYPGRMAVIPQGTRHKVVAGNDGLILLAKFFPALL